MDPVSQAQSWIELDPDLEHRQAVLNLIDAGDTAALSDLFTGRVAFGTAGLRAPMGPGPNRMNRLVVQQTTAGLLRWMKQSGYERPRVVIGYDARHRSAEFAIEAAEVIGAAGAEAIIADDVVPTPALALAILTHNADAGIMITASHNPPADNGYKLYLGDGIQIIPPADAGIASAIDEIASGSEPTTFGAASDPQYVPARRWESAHREVALSLIPGPERSARVVYTAMHGVGGAPFVTAALEAGFDRPIVVDAQFDPDPDFSTVSFPNPEEPGALDLALELAARESVDAVIAHDPDADRLAIAVPGPRGWTQLSGDQVGWLLAEHLLSSSDGDRSIVAKSLVSSQRLEAIAASHPDSRCITTLTGFKWVARPIVEHPDDRFVLGYEEALGYCVGGAVRDKDGISAALVAMQMLSALQDAGKTVWDVLDRMDADHGAYRSSSFSHRLGDGQPSTEEILSGLLQDPPSHGPEASEVLDLRTDGDLPPTDGVLIRYADSTRLIVRPSGTEPKVKFYLEAIAEPENAEKALRGLQSTLQTWLESR